MTVHEIIEDCMQIMTMMVNYMSKVLVLEFLYEHDDPDD